MADMNRRNFLSLTGLGVVGLGLPVAVANPMATPNLADTKATRHLFDIQKEGRRLRVSTGIPRLDEELGGGWRKGSINLIHGAPNTGRTTMIAHTVFAALQSGLRVAVFDDEHFERWWFSRAHRYGINLRVTRATGTLDSRLTHLSTLACDGWADVVVGDFDGLNMGSHQHNGLPALISQGSATVVLTATTHPRRSTIDPAIARVSDVVVRTVDGTVSGWGTEQEVVAAVEKHRTGRAGAVFHVSFDPIRPV